MAELKFKPVPHDHETFLSRARARNGSSAEYEAIELEYQVAGQMLKARSRAGLTQNVVAERMGTTKSAISRLESAGKHAPSLATLKRYASAVGCDLQVKTWCLAPVAFARCAGVGQVQASLVVSASSTSRALLKEEIVLLTLYAKSTTDNLTGAKLKEIRRVLEG